MATTRTHTGDELVIQSPVITSTTFLPSKKSNLEIRLSRNLIFPLSRPPIRHFRRIEYVRNPGLVRRMIRMEREISNFIII